MELGIFAKTFSRPTLEGVLDAVSEPGLRCVQFNFACAGLPTLPHEIAPSLLTQIRRALDERNLRVAAVSGTFNMIHPDPREREKGLRGLAAVASASAELGASLMTLCTGTRDPEDMWRGHRDNGSIQAWEDLVQTLQEALFIAERHDLTLGIEPEIGNVISSARQARRLLDAVQSPRLKVVIDPANLFHRGELPKMRPVLDEAFGLLGREIIMAHAKDISSDPEEGFTAAGEGVLDWDYYLRHLSLSGFGGPLILHGLPESRVDASVAFLREKLEKL